MIEDRLDIGDVHVAYRVAGSGPPLVLLHGGLADWRDVRPQMESFADSYTVVAWDAPGCGASDDPPESWMLADWADALAELIRRLDLTPAHVAGVSFGGGLAIQLSERHPDTVRSLVLCSAYAGWAGSLSEEEVRRRLSTMLPLLERPADELVAMFLPTLFSSEVSAEILEESATMIREHHPRGTRTLLRAFAAADLRAALPRIRVPTLIVAGELDPRAPVRSVAEPLHAAIPGSRLVVVSGAGHMVNLEAPEEFERDVRAFLASA